MSLSKTHKPSLVLVQPRTTRPVITERFLMGRKEVNQTNKHVTFFFQKLNAVHELQLLEMICSSLQEAPEQSRYNVFSAIFGGHVDTAKINLLSKLVSMAISISCAAVLGCAALWMQV